MESHEETAQDIMEGSSGPGSPRPSSVDPIVGIMDPDDTLELLRDALRQGHGFEHMEELTTTERMQLTAHSALEPFSYDVHVKLGMELMALRRQEANQRLDAEQFGEQLKRRAFVRDMLKRVTKEDNWVQYPASDLERITRALDRSKPKARGDGKAKSSLPSYTKWLERRKKSETIGRTAFGSTMLNKRRGSKGVDAISEAAAAFGAADGSRKTANAATERVSHRAEDGRLADGDSVTATTFGMAPRLMGPIISGGQSHRSLSPSGARRITEATRIMIRSRGGPRSGRGEAAGEDDGDDEYDDQYGDGDDDGDDPRGDGRAGSRGACAGVESHVFAVRFRSDDFSDDDEDEERRQLASAAEILGLGGSGKDGRRGMYGRTQSDLLMAAANALAGVDGEDLAGSKLGWRAVLKRNRAYVTSAAAAAATAAAAASEGPSRVGTAGGSGGVGDLATATDEELEAAETNPFLAMRLSVRRELSYNAPPPTAAPAGVLDAAATAALAAVEPAPPGPEVEPPLSALEDAVKAVASIADDDLDAFSKAMEAAAAAAAAADGAAGADLVAAAAAAEAAAAMASAKVEAWAAEASVRLEAAREEYSLAHADKLESITAIADLQRQLQLLRDWIAGRERKRLAAAAAELTAQHDRVAAAAGRSPAVARLLENCSLAAEELDNMAVAVEAAADEVAAALEEKEQRRAALRLIEQECVQLAEEMAAREETERLAGIMKAEAEAARRMAEAQDDDEARRHALLAAILMGQEEWVLEKEARLAALRAAERDEKRLGVLRAAEADKARAAEAVGRPYDKSLLAELIELEQAARREGEVRRKRLDEALGELAHFEEMLRREQLQVAAEAAAAAAAEAAAPPPAPAADPGPESLIRAAVAAVRECVNKAAAEAEEALVAAELTSPGEEAAQGEGKALEAPEAGSHLVRLAQARLAEARAGLQAAAETLEGALHGAASADALEQVMLTHPPSVMSSIAPSAAASRAVSRVPSFMRRQDAAAGLRTAQQELLEEQARLAALVQRCDAVQRGPSRQALQAVLVECDALAAAVAAAADAKAQEESGSAEEDEKGRERAGEVAPELLEADSQGDALAGEWVGTDDDAAVAAAAAAAAPESRPPQSPRPPLPPSSLLQPSMRTATMPLHPPVSPSGALGPPVVRARASGPGLSPTPVTMGANHANTSEYAGRDWSLRPDPLPSSQGHGGSGDGRHGIMMFGAACGTPPPPLPAVHPHAQSGAARVSGLSAKALQVHLQLQQNSLQQHNQQQQASQQQSPFSPQPLHHSPAGLVAPYGRGLPPPLPLSVLQSNTQPQVALPFVVTPETPGSSSRRGVLITGRAGLGPLAAAAGAPDFLPPIGAGHSPTAAGGALAAPPPTPRGITLDGTAAPTTPRMPSPTPVSPGRHNTNPFQVQQQPHAVQQQQQHHHHHQRQTQHTLWPGAAVDSRKTRSTPASPEPPARAMPTRTSAASPSRRGAAAAAAAGAGPGASRQALSVNSSALPSPSTQSHGVNGHSPRRQEHPPAGPAEEDNAAAASGSGSGSGGRGGARPGHVAAATTAARSAAAAAGLPPAAVQSLGEASYSQWISTRSPPHHLTPRALDAARQVDEALSRLPAELHSVLLNAAELLTLEAGGYDAVQHPSGAVAATAPGAGGGVGVSSVPVHLQALPPLVSRYIMSQLERIYNGAGSSGGGGGGGGGGSGGGGNGGGGSGGGAGKASGGGTLGGEAPILSSEQSLAALELLNQLLPAIAQSVAQVRTRMHGGSGGGGSSGGGSGGAGGSGGGSPAPSPAASAPAAPAVGSAPGHATPAPMSAIAYEASRCPLGTGPMHGSPLKSSRRTRSTTLDSGDGGISSHSSASSSASAVAAPMAAPSPASVGPHGSPQGPRVRQQTLMLSTQPVHHGASGGAGAGNGNGGGSGGVAGAGGGKQRRGMAGAAAKTGRNGGGCEQRQQRDCTDADRWMIRGVNVQAAPKGPGHPQQQHPGGSTPQAGMAADAGAAVAADAMGVGRGGMREAFLPPLGQGHKLTAVRH